MEAFEIIKKRYPEVLLIVGLYVGFTLLARQIMDTAVSMQGGDGEAVGNLPAGLDFLYGMGFVIICIVWQMLQLGFLRTAFTDGTAQQEPKTLLLTGKTFFWRIIRFQLVFGMMYLSVVVICTELVVWTMYNGVEFAELPKWIGPVCSLVATAVLVKPMLLCQAIMISKDCMVKDSFVRMKSYRLRECPELVKIFAGLIAAVFVFSMIEETVESAGAGHWVMIGVQGTITSSLWLIVLLRAIGFVAEKQDFTAENAEGGEEERKLSTDYTDGTD